MSKIQQALEKLRASEERNAKRSGSDNVVRHNSYVDELEPLSDAENISGMNQPREMSFDEMSDAKLFFTEMADRKVYNAFRNLRTTVSQRVSEPSPIIMVTSCVLNSGGSFVAMNLASSIAMDASRTSMLVDCNFSSPGFKDLSVTDIKVGLKDYLYDSNHSVNEIIYPTGIPRMRLIPAGNSEVPIAEFFTSVRMKNLFTEIQKRYQQRFIIVDAPPVSENADTRILSQVCDHVILVVPHGKVTEEQVLTAARAVGKEKLLGTVFNNQPRFPVLTS